MEPRHTKRANQGLIRGLSGGRLRGELGLLGVGCGAPVRWAVEPFFPALGFPQMGNLQKKTRTLHCKQAHGGQQFNRPSSSTLKNEFTKKIF